MPEGYRKYLLGHAPGRDAAVAYTHLNRLRETYQTVIRDTYAPVLAAIKQRRSELANAQITSATAVMDGPWKMVDAQATDHHEVEKASCATMDCESFLDVI